MELVHSKHEPGVPSTNHINVRFVPLSPVQFQIRHAMNTPSPNPHGKGAASLFAMASRFEPAVPMAGLKDPELGPEHSHFADLVARPEKLEQALRAARAENDAFAASRTVSHRSPQPSSGSPPRIESAGKTPGIRAGESREIEFTLEAPAAKSVKLAADFTGWQKCPLHLAPSGRGVWSGVIRLEPGEYAYRFIVDGQWCDDPRTTRRVRNPYGTENALLVVS